MGHQVIDCKVCGAWIMEGSGKWDCDTPSCQYARYVKEGVAFEQGKVVLDIERKKLYVANYKLKYK